MPHKRNPVAALIGIAAALRAPQHVACLLAAMPQENERGLGTWQAELAEWPELVVSVHGSTHAMALALEGLQVFPQRMRANIEATHGLVFAEAAAALLADVLPPGAGAALVGELCAEISRQVGAPPSLRDLLLKAVTRRSGAARQGQRRAGAGGLRDRTGRATPCGAHPQGPAVRGTVAGAEGACRRISE